MTTRDFDHLLAMAKQVPQTSAQLDEQRRSFAFGNTNIENDRITKEMVDRVADKLAAESNDK